MAYTTPLKVFQSINAVEAAEETFSGVSGGDTVELSNFYIIENTENITIDGSPVPDSDYSVDLEANTATYTGTSSGELVVDYQFGPYSSATVNDRIAGVEDYIDDFTNSTYDGLATVTDEYYDGAGSNERLYVFTKRPVRNVSAVAVNEATSSQNNPNYVTLTEGLGEDFVTYQDLGVKFLPLGKSPNDDPRDLKVTYDYGYENVPSDLRVAATEMVVDDLVRGTVSGAMVDGVDNFDPQTVNVNVESYREVLERYRIERMENMVDLAEEGSIS